MSDFVSSGWSWWVIASRRKVMAGDNTTGHVWDGDLREMNNPLPRWWVWLFVITVVFSLAYLYLYPGLGKATGSLNWSSSGQHATEVAKGANINLANVSGDTPLHIAAATGQTAMAELLLQNGANPRLRAVSGLTPAALATSNGHSATAAAIRTRPAAPVRATDPKVGVGTPATATPLPRGA